MKSKKFYKRLFALVLDAKRKGMCELCMARELSEMYQFVLEQHQPTEEELKQHIFLSPGNASQDRQLQ